MTPAQLVEGQEDAAGVVGSTGDSDADTIPAHDQAR